MFRAILETQWRSTRGLVLLASILAFGVPLLSLQSARGRDAASFVQAMQVWGAAYAMVAALLGLLVAMAAWRADHLGRHTYALSLPIDRSRYSLYRLGAGALFLAPAVVAVLVGALLVAVSGAIPSGLHAYPVALTLRFALASVVAFALFFAISASSSRTAGYILAVIVGIVFAQFLVAALGRPQVDILGPVLEFILYRPGILSVFAGRWMLVDV